MYRFIEKQKAMELLNIKETTLRTLINRKELTLYGKQGSKMFLKLKEVYKIIEKNKQEVEYIKSLSLEEISIKNEISSKEKNYYLNFTRNFLQNIGSPLYDSDNIKNKKTKEIFDLTIKRNGDFSYVADVFGLSRERVKKLFEKELWRYSFAIERLKEYKCLKKYNEDLLAENTSLRDVNNGLLKKIEQITGDKQLNSDKYIQVLSINIADLDLSCRSYNCLKSVKINYLGDLIKYSKKELKRVRNFGNSSFIEVEEMLYRYGLKLNE